MSKNNFAGLLAELGVAAAATETLAKSVAAAEQPKDDKLVTAAAAEAGVQKPVIAAGEGGADDGAGVDDDEDAGEEFGKSVSFVDSEGKEHVGVDATELVKSLVGRIDSTDDLLAKALPQLLSTINTQGDMIKSLHARLEQVSGQGRGRKTMLMINEKPVVGEQLAKSGAAAEAAGEGKITAEDLLAKADAAYAAKKITGVEYSTIDVCLRNREPIDAKLLSKVALS